MKKSVRKLCWWNVIIFSLLYSMSAAQTIEQAKQDAEAKKSTRIKLGDTSAVPGQPALVPIYLTPAEGVEVGDVKVEITFVSANMKFEKLERGIAAEMADIELTGDVKVGKNDKGVETSTVIIQTKPSNSEPRTRGISAGLLAYLTLKVSESGRPAVITLHTAAEVRELGSNKPLTNVRTGDAIMEVFAPGTQPAVSCFFFSH